MKNYEILFTDSHTEIVDHSTMEDIVYELESFERDDVSQIHLLKDNGDFDTIWTEEEGLFVNYGELDSEDEDSDEDSGSIPRDVKEDLIDWFWIELGSWDWESWSSSGSNDKEEIVRNLLPKFTSVLDEETIYDLFYEWSNGLSPEDFE